MSFWDKVLAGNTPQPRQETPAYQPQQTSQPWFRAYDQQPPQQQFQPAQPEVDPHEAAALQKAMSARSTASCPECGSGNIFKPKGMPNAMEQCYNCGWNPRFAHSTAGAGLPSSEGGPAHPSRQVSKGNNFNPKTFDPAQGGAGRLVL